MMRVILEDTDTGRTAHADIAPSELDWVSGVQLAALLIPGAEPGDIETINQFLAHYRTQ